MTIECRWMWRHNNTNNVWAVTVMRLSDVLCWDRAEVLETLIEANSPRRLRTLISNWTSNNNILSDNGDKWKNNSTEESHWEGDSQMQEMFMTVFSRISHWACLEASCIQYTHTHARAHKFLWLILILSSFLCVGLPRAFPAVFSDLNIARSSLFAHACPRTPISVSLSRVSY